MITHLFNCDISDYTTFHISAVVSEFIEYDTSDELAGIIKELNGMNRKFIHIGGGSNILFASKYDGVVLHCRSAEIREVKRTVRHALIQASSGTVWDDFVKYTVDNGLYGAENLSYIPGEVGGAAVQNVGAYGVEAKNIIESVEVLNTENYQFLTLSADDCCYGYRSSIFKYESGRKYLVCGVTFKLSSEPFFSLEYGPLKDLVDNSDLTLQKVRNQIIAIRKSKLPEPDELGSAGSFFKNPVVDFHIYENLKTTNPDIPSFSLPNGKVKIPAGWLIEHSGLKGYKIGNAEVFPKQCLVIVNTGGASAEDVLRLKKHIQDTVWDKFGIEITPEVNLVGL